jgi:serine protease Do
LGIKSIPRFLLIMLAFCILPASADSAGSNELQKMVDAAVLAVKPALVRIHAISTEDSEGREIKEESFGSGVIISAEGYVITNHHVAGHAKQIFCTLSDRTEIDAKLVSTDAATDIAVVKLAADQQRKFPFAKFGDSSIVKVGDTVLAMGCPLALSQSVTMGIVSNTELVMPDMFGEFTLDGENIGSLVRWIGHDATIYPGNSGGPLVNMQGEIVGINEIDIGLGGAIPGNLARDIADQLVKQGKVCRSWVGITIQPLLKDSPCGKGVLISSTLDDSPAKAAGFLPGDILVRLAGKECCARFAEELPIFNQYASNLPAGKEVDAVVLRDGKEIKLKITPESKENAAAKSREIKEWGICGCDLTFFIAKEMKRSQSTGVLVTSLRPGGPAAGAKPAILEGDVIVGMDGKPVKCFDDLRRLTAEITVGKEEPVPTIVAFERGTDQYLTVVKLGIQDFRDPGLEVRKAWLPVNIQVLTKDMAEALKLNGRMGARITRIYPNTDAEKSGLKIGDIIVQLDGMAIEATEPEDVEVLPAMIRQYKVGSKVDLTILRDGQELSVPVVLPQSPQLPREMKRHHDDNFELTVRDICFFDRAERRWPETQTGVLVVSTEEGGWASVGGIHSGDLILTVGGQTVPSVATFQDRMRKTASEKPRRLVMQVRRGIHDIYIEIEPDW